MTRKAALLLANGLILLSPPVIAMGRGEGLNPSTFNAVSGLSRIPAVTANSASPASIAPAVTVTPSLLKITVAQTLTVTAAVRGSSGKSTPTGSVKLASGKFVSAVGTLVKGSFTFHIAAGVLAAGKDTLTVTYTPDSASVKIYRSASGEASVTVTKIAPALAVKLSSPDISTQQELTVTVAVSAGAGAVTPTGNVQVDSGAYASSDTGLAGGKATIQVRAGSLQAGKDKLTVTYTPDAKSSALYIGASASKTVTVTKITPVVALELSSSTITTVEALTVKVAVGASAGDATPTGSVSITSGSYSSPGKALAGGKATIDIPAGALATGADTLSAVYTPDATSSRIYNPASASSTAISVVVPTTVTVDQASTGPAVTDQLLGMNMAAWYDLVDNSAAILDAFQAAGIKALRWPGGSWSDVYHWEDNANCQNPPYGGGDPSDEDTFGNFVSYLAAPGGTQEFDVALTADYGTNEACNGPGQPSEAANWIKQAIAEGIAVSHMTVGNEVYGSLGWEENLNNPTSVNQAATQYAAAVAGASGFYKSVKAAGESQSSPLLVGVDVDADDLPASNPDAWDNIVLNNAAGYYDFVEYHYYPQAPGSESDLYLTEQAAQGLTENINIVKSELAAAGKPDTPIYVGEMGSVYTNPGKQTMSITQGLYAGQMLGEMMNDGVSRATWWIGFGNCNGTNGNDSASLYGWQDFGAYNVFADGPSDTGCAGAGPIGTMSPTARAFQLFSNVAVSGESVLSANVAGDTTDVRAYAATHSGGTALVLFNLNETTTEAVAVTLSGQSASSAVTVETYSKAIYDQSQNNVWAPPTTTILDAQSLPLSLFLAPWSMNVVLIK